MMRMGEQERKRNLNEKVFHSYFSNFNFSWNHPVSCSGSERPHLDSNFFLLGMVRLCCHSANRSLPCKARPKD